MKAKQFDAERLSEIAGIALQSLKITPYSLYSPARIFINRKEYSGRYISNFSQLQPILTKYSFKTVYLEDVDIPGQIGMMSSAELIVGIHGAGLTNLIFADKEKAQVIEILPKNFQPTHYYWLCDVLSIKYKVFFGADLIADKGFEIDVERFEEVIIRYVESL